MDRDQNRISADWAAVGSQALQPNLKMECEEMVLPLVLESCIQVWAVALDMVPAQPELGRKTFHRPCSAQF